MLPRVSDNQIRQCLKQIMNATLIQEPLRSIITPVPTGLIFDSHFVIAKLIKEHSDAYLRFAASIGANVETETMHGFIAMEIGKLDGVVQIQPGAYSENIHGEPSKCACWERRFTECHVSSGGC